MSKMTLIILNDYNSHVELFVQFDVFMVLKNIYIEMGQLCDETDKQKNGIFDIPSFNRNMIFC